MSWGKLGRRGWGDSRDEKEEEPLPLRHSDHCRGRAGWGHPRGEDDLCG